MDCIVFQYYRVQKISMDDAPGAGDHDGMQLGFHTCTLLTGTLMLAACGSGPISIDDGSGETGSDDGETGTGDTGDTGDTDGPEELACVDEDGLVRSCASRRTPLARG
jgi:hypothetical protein